MGKPRKEHSEEESIFANNPFIEGLFEWMDSPEGEKHLEIYDIISKLLEDVHLDARERKVIWPDAERLDIEQSVQRIQKRYRDFPRGEIEEFMIDWIDMGYEPENYSPAQFDELDRLTERWVADHLLRGGAGRTRTNHQSVMELRACPTSSPCRTPDTDSSLIPVRSWEAASTGAEG